MKSIYTSLFSLIIIFTACTDDSEAIDKTDDGSSSTGVPSTLHMAFKTPDWSRQIDCTLLDLSPYAITVGVFGVNATSQSTSETFYFSYPSDSSAFVQSTNLKKYSIAEYGMNEDVFQFSQKLPVTSGSSDRLISLAGSAEDQYNEVVEIKFDHSEENYAVFKIKCRYSMQTYVLSDQTTQKLVTGTYHLKVRTTHN